VLYSIYCLCNVLPIPYQGSILAYKEAFIIGTFDKITKYDTLRIIKGEYKGKKGMVKDLLGDMCVVELDDDLEMFRYILVTVSS